MAFYSPTWIRKLVKEDHKNIQKYLEDQKNDFRKYIDANTPFVLWLDIALIRERILSKSKDQIQEIALAVSQTRDVSQIVMNLLDEAYVDTINAYANNPRYKKITDVELEQLLTNLSNAELGKVKSTVLRDFKNTMVVTNVTKPNKSVMLILPKFTTLEFGTVFKKQLKQIVEKTNLLEDSAPVAPTSPGNMFAGLVKADAKSSDSEKARMLNFVSENFAKLQNIGHVEVDVISEADKKIMRGQNSPRLLQALVTLPNDTASFQRLQLKFSKETGQAATRVKVRKRFSGSKLVFELLVEHGLSVGIPETQQDNLYKAGLERAFSIGAGLTAELRKNIGILADLETSKSIKNYVVDLIKKTATGKKVATYESNTVIEEKTSVTKTRVSSTQLKRNAKNSSTPTVSMPSRQIAENVLANLSSIQRLLDMYLVARVKENMGNGNRRDILNLRSGRLAESVKTERLSISREGMLTVFYSYMKNPYATFSQGGAQQYPKSRDPKLLISTSIRDILKKDVSSRLRSVAV